MSENIEQNFNQAEQDLQQITQQAEQNIETQTPEMSEIEKKAYNMGWRPQGEYSGSNYVPAEEYVNRAPLFDRIERQSKEIRELKDLVKESTNHFTIIRKEAYENAIRDLELKRMHAVENGNTAQFRALDAQATALKTKMQNDQSLQPKITKLEPDPIANQFVEDNRFWYNQSTDENRLMVQAAQGIDQLMAQKASLEGRPLDKKAHLNAVLNEVKRLFPHRFENMKREQPNTVGKSTGAPNTKNLSGLVSRLSPSQRELGLKFQRSNPAYTLEMYAKDLESMGRLGK